MHRQGITGSVQQENVLGASHTSPARAELECEGAVGRAAHSKDTSSTARPIAKKISLICLTTDEWLILNDYKFSLD